MQRSPLNNITRIILGVLIGGAVMIGVAYAIDTKMDGWVSTAAVKNITIYDDSCRRLSGVAGYFVPTRTATEWNAFNAVAASKGLTVASCAAHVNCSYTTTGWGACSASCGGGSQSYYYTITAAAQNGGTCPVSQGQVAGTQACNTQACTTYSWYSGAQGTCGGDGRPGYNIIDFACRNDQTSLQVDDSYCRSYVGNIPGCTYGGSWASCVNNPRPATPDYEWRWWKTCGQAFDGYWIFF